MSQEFHAIYPKAANHAPVLKKDRNMDKFCLKLRQKKLSW